jgi:hypothetical protein
MPPRGPLPIDIIAKPSERNRYYRRPRNFERFHYKMPNISQMEIFNLTTDSQTLKIETWQTRYCIQDIVTVPSGYSQICLCNPKVSEIIVEGMDYGDNYRMFVSLDSSCRNSIILGNTLNIKGRLTLTDVENENCINCILEHNLPNPYITTLQQSLNRPPSPISVPRLSFYLTINEQHEKINSCTCSQYDNKT